MAGGAAAGQGAHQELLGGEEMELRAERYGKTQAFPLYLSLEILKSFETDVCKSPYLFLCKNILLAFCSMLMWSV